MKFSAEQIEAIKEALVQGEKSVQFNGRKIEFRSVSEMQQIVSMTDTRPFHQRRHRAIFDKGI